MRQFRIMENNNEFKIQVLRKFLKWSWWADCCDLRGYSEGYYFLKDAQRDVNILKQNEIINASEWKEIKGGE